MMPPGERYFCMTDVPTIEYAIRYCMTRQSYAFYDGLDLAERHWRTLDDATRSDVLGRAGEMQLTDLAKWPTIAHAIA